MDGSVESRRMSLERGKDVAELVLSDQQAWIEDSTPRPGEGQAVEVPFCCPIPGEVECPSVW